MIDTLLMETASDEWLADFDGDGLAEMALGRLPVRTAVDASRIIDKGYFIDPQLNSLGKALIKWNIGGAVAVWASSGMTMPGDQSVMDIEAFTRLFDPNRSLTLGEITLQAKAKQQNKDVRLTWILFGDPTTRLR